MRTIAIPGIDIRIPVVGFGCSALSSTGEKAALQVLGAAFEAGVRHFDVARYYGYGESEGILGKFVKSRRLEVTITSKFGIEPPKRTNALRLAMQAGRSFVQLVPAARGFLQKRAQGLVKGGAFSVSAARASLETSLRELGSDYIDFYLLHDYAVNKDSPQELIAFLKDAVKAGKIRNFGIGTGISNVLQAMEAQPELCNVVQFENSVLRRNVRKLPQGGPQTLTITHGSLSASYQAISAFLKTNGDVARNWSAKLSIDCSRDEILSALMLNYSVRMNPDGLVLFSSRNAARVMGNAKAALEPTISAAQVELFGMLVEQDLMRSIQTA